MRIQVLVATMHQIDHSLLSKMNIRSDAIIGNQCDRNEIEEFIWNGHNIKYLNFAERGVGLNRNNSLMRADADICVFADDDMVFDDDYVDTLERVFHEHPEADVLLFNLHEKIITQPIIKKKSEIGYFNYLRYGTARIAFRLSKVKHYGIYFNQCFGGGTIYCHGEDNLFLNACLKKGLKLVAIPEYIASLNEERESSWNHGYNEKYINDQGVLYHALSRRWWKLLCFQDSFRRCKSYQRSFIETYKMMLKGGQSIKEILREGENYKSI
jgi:glycosyltransferase involved in cell wall biosynthesis